MLLMLRYVNELDKRISSIVFCSVLPSTLEGTLSTFGTWFGVPTVALLFAPLCIAGVASPSECWILSVVACVLLLLWWQSIVREAASLQPPFTNDHVGFLRAYKPLSNSRMSLLISFAASPHAALYLLSLNGDQSSVSAASSFISCWMTSVTIVEVRLLRFNCVAQPYYDLVMILS